ncbi:RHS repeat-associated core domain-containing protein [Pseudomonas sp. T1.Ur]|uniref:RHS repeat domain-containing protein n=1 Tax=Pseudomonas sp. T1.Ur TaxID=2928704 RepID=UPI00201D9499|nr:RHS repeat-associated core domain-containing protein [Pseudomonas sp. T1.Ur]MCL6703675.1 RHS repeat-associated core domain-containing protein [Pseudomonas sp. T1.Ur]
MLSSLHQYTPTLTATDPRGLVIRNVAYHRASAGVEPDAHIHRQTFGPSGLLLEQWDPRLFQLHRGRRDTGPAQCGVHSLSGQSLRTDSADAGWRVVLWGASGQRLDDWDGRGAHRQREYDRLLRPVAVYEKDAGEPALRCVERLGYGGDSADHRARNRCGRLVHHADPAGKLVFARYDLLGQVTLQSRRFRREVERADWPAMATQRRVLLEDQVFATRWRRNAVGDVIGQLDARGNRQGLSYGLDGRLRRIELTPRQGTRQTVMDECVYDACGELISERAGNGVRSVRVYRPEDARLVQMRSWHSTVGLLQDLRYRYDPVGNVSSIEDRARPIHYFANQAIEPVSRYRYDTLGRLIEATGWETGTSSQGPARPDDPRARSRYRQIYHYDHSGNLLDLLHQGGQDHGRRLVASSASNRCLATRGDHVPTQENLRDGFDANGNLLQLQPGQVLTWNVRNQLQEAVVASRKGGADDRERYVYDADGIRVRKISEVQVGPRVLRAEVCYLPGLELRMNSATGERLQIMTINTGHGTVQVLHWEDQPPKGMPSHAWRYCRADHLQSSCLELDSLGRVISRETYHPFGTTAAIERGDSPAQSYRIHRYSGKERDATGLYCYALRYYIPGWQRWLSPDPAGDVDGLNRYGFVQNNPITRLDRDGLTGWPFNRRSDGFRAMIEIYKRPSVNGLRAYQGWEGQLFLARLESLQWRADAPPGIGEYAEGGDGVSDHLNSYLRGVPIERNVADLRQTAMAVRQMRAEVERQPDYFGFAYRAARGPAETFGKHIKVGSTVVDAAFMSASVIPHSAIQWLETWTDRRPDATPGQQRVLLVFDRQVRKKVAATDFLADHVLIPPLTLLQVTKIHTIRPGPADAGVTVVKLKPAVHADRHKVRSLWDGRVLKPALNPGLLSRIRSRLRR